MNTRAQNYGLIAGAPTDADESTLALLKGYVRGHTKNPTIPDASDVWAIATAFLADGQTDYPISWRDIASDEAWTRRMLDMLSVQQNDFLYFAYIYSQSGQTWPWLKCAFDRGAKVATGMPTHWDAYRLEMYLRMFDVKVVFGVTGAILDGLQSSGFDIAKTLAKSSHLLVLPDAWERLRAVGLRPWKLQWAGPILVVDPCDGKGARFDSANWTFESDAGRILITNNRPRLMTFEKANTGLRGHIEIIDGEQRLFDEA